MASVSVSHVGPVESYYILIGGLIKCAMPQLMSPLTARPREAVTPILLLEDTGVPR